MFLRVDVATYSAQATHECGLSRISCCINAQIHSGAKMLSFVENIKFTFSNCSYQLELEPLLTKIELDFSRGLNQFLVELSFIVLKHKF